MWTRLFPVALLAVALLFAGMADALAKAGSSRSSSGSSSLGSKGSRPLDSSPPPGGGFLRPPTVAQPMTPPPAPNVAPRTGGPVESIPLQPSMAARPSTAMGAAPMAAAAQPGFFQRNPFMAGMAGGLVGAGIGSLLFGHSPALAAASEMAPGASLLGLLVQLALIGGLIWLVMRLVRRNRAPQDNPFAMARGPVEPRLRPVAPTMAPPAYAPQPSFAPPVYAPQPSYAPPAPPVDRAFEPTPADQEAFSAILLGVQQAWSTGDRAALSRLVAPDLLAQLADDLARDAADGVANRVEQVRLLKGEVRESWRERGLDYVTAPLTFQCIDVMVRTRDGAVVSGDPRVPVIHSEAWTFVRPSNGGVWQLTAIERG